MRRLSLVVVLMIWGLAIFPAVYAQDSPARPPITPQNASQLSLINTLGRGGVRDAEWSPDGKTLAVLSSGGIWLHNMDHPIAEPRLLTSQAGSTRMVFSSDSRWLAVGLEDGTIHLWDIPAMSLAFSWDGGDVPVSGLAFNADNTILAGVNGSWATEIDVITLWDVTTGNIRATTDAFSSEQVAFAQDNSLLIAASDQVLVWNWSDGSPETPETIIELGGVLPLDFEFNRGGTLIATNDMHTVDLYDLVSGEKYMLYENWLSAYMNCLDFSLDGGFVAAGSPNGGVYIWNTTTHEQEASPRTPLYVDVVALTFSPTNDQIAVFTSDGVLHLWDINEHFQQEIISGYSGYSNLLEFGLDDTTLIAANSSGSIVWQWDISSGQLVQLGYGPQYSTGMGMIPYIDPITFSLRANLFASGVVQSGVVHLWRPDGEPRGLLETNRNYNVLAVAFNDAGTILAASTGDRVFLWDTRDGKSLIGLIIRSGTAAVLAFNPEGTVLTVGLWGGTIVLRDTATEDRRILGTMEGHTGTITSLSFSPDGRLLASASKGDESEPKYSIRLWDTLTEETVATFSDHTDMVTHVVFSPDGTVLASSSQDGTVRLWDVATGENLAVLNMPVYWGKNIVFSHDGTLLAGVGSDDIIRLWGIPQP
ncbi:MAG: WD40 repeat domain-containing protein [Chloroflexi bacterium]|nr:WD40 repeat domain-containing protein [Chloroflexota bacterium]